eukprot:scaffold39125_cov194-Skeletonema_marinoi.AAC.1
MQSQQHLRTVFHQLSHQQSHPTNVLLTGMNSRLSLIGMSGMGVAKRPLYALVSVTYMDGRSDLGVLAT